MRVFVERHGKSAYPGEHPIYESIEEFKRERGDISLIKWGEGSPETLQAGQWMIVDDGYIIQILKVKSYQNKQLATTYFVRVAMGTFPVYYTKSNGWVWRRLYAQFICGNKTSLSHRRPNLGGIGTIDKIKFATLFLSGIPITKAILAVYPRVRSLTRHQLLLKGINLMNDEVVKTEIRDQIAKFSGDIEEKFGDARIIEELDMLLIASEKGSIVHQKNIQFIMELRGLYNNQTSQKKLGSKAENAEYTEIPPSEG